MNYENILIVKENNIATITINRPDKIKCIESKLPLKNCIMLLKNWNKIKKSELLF